MSEHTEALAAARQRVKNAEAEVHAILQKLTLTELVQDLTESLKQFNESTTSEISKVVTEMQQKMLERWNRDLRDLGDEKTET